MPALLVYNLGWMSFNVVLAIIPVVLGYWLLRTSYTWFSVLLFPIWLLFLPNTVYLLTDLIHLPEDLRALPSLYHVVIWGLYLFLVVLGLLTYILAMYPVISFLRKKLLDSVFFWLLVINFFQGVGLVLGRMFRFNSWDILIRPLSIFHILLTIVTTPVYLSLCLLFTLFASLFYLLTIPLLIHVSEKKKQKKQKRRK